MKWILFFIALMVTASAQTAGLSFEQALSKAHSMESNLGQQDAYRLIMAQGDFLGKAVPVCVNKIGRFEDKFTVIVSLDASGRVDQVWRQPENEFVACFASEMKRQFSFDIDETSFFTAIEYTTNNEIEWDYD
ncbi:hypothetical protein [Kangiella sp. M94]